MTTHPFSAKVSTPSDREVEVTRTLDAPRALVWEAYTDPALVRRWLLGPPGWTMPICEMDVRVGGAYRWAWRSEADGKQFGFHGEFLEVTPRERIVHSETYDPGDIGGSMGDATSRVTVTFAEAGGRTTLTTLVDYGSKETRDAVLATGMADGMESGYKLLDELLAGS
jgi:uncharacterized protein YndB with AHSA1/START domain